MSKIVQSLADLWVKRKARPDEAALRAVADLKPATVITGASRGIGLELAKQFAEHGDTVVLVARHLAALNEAAAEINAGGLERQAFAVALDVTEPRAFEQIAAALRENGLYLDVLINNAAMGLGDGFLTQSPEAVDRLVALNVGAMTRLTRLVLPDMVARGRGGLLNVASLGGYVPGPYQAAYYASKAYVISLTEAIAAEHAGSGVRISVLAPGPVDTGFHARMGADRALYRWVLPSASAARVAASARRDFVLGRRVIVPSLLYLVGAALMRVMPHPISVPIVAWLLKPPAGSCLQKSSA